MDPPDPPDPPDELDEPGPRARAIHDWLMALVAADRAGLGPDAGLHAAPLPAALAEGTPADFAAASFRFARPDLGLSNPGRHLVHVRFAPGGHHRALLVRRADWPGALLWLDARPVPVPRDAQGLPLAEAPGHWADDGAYGVPVGGLFDHPLHDPRAISTLGTVFALLACDLRRGTQQLLSPRADQAWAAPRLRCVDGRFEVAAG